MLVRRSDVSFFCSIQRDRCVTGAKAISASLAGSGGGSSWLRTKASRVGTNCPGSTGFHRVAGATSGSSATFRGPTRRSSSGAIDRRQVSAAIFRSSAFMVTMRLRRTPSLSWRTVSAHRASNSSRVTARPGRRCPWRPQRSGTATSWRPPVQSRRLRTLSRQLRRRAERRPRES